jgi:hypothetical protein
MNDTPQSPPIKGLGKLIHIAGWGILFCSPFFFTGRESQVTFEGYFRSIIVPLSFMLVFYLNYGWPPDRAFPADQPIAYRGYDAVRASLHALFLSAGDASPTPSAPPVE